MRSSSNCRRIPIASVALAAAIAGAACRTTDDRPAVWTYISAELFQPNCATASCHSQGRAVSGLDFSDPGRGYKSLTGLHVWIPDPDGKLGGNCVTADGMAYCERDRPLVVAFDYSQSRLRNMLRAQAAPRMPPDRPLPEADIALVEAWILDGARETPGGPPAGTEAPDGGASDGATDGAGGKDGGDAGGGDGHDAGGGAGAGGEGGHGPGGSSGGAGPGGSSGGAGGRGGVSG